MVRAEPPFLLTDPYFEGGQKFMITKVESHDVFVLVKDWFQKGDLYRVRLDVEPFLWVKQVSRHDFGPAVEVKLSQIGPDVSIHLVYVTFSSTPYDDPMQSLRLMRYIFKGLGREVPVDILGPLQSRDVLLKEQSNVTNLLVFFLIGVGVVSVALLNAGVPVSAVVLLVPVVVVVYYLYGLRKKGLSIENVG